MADVAQTCQCLASKTKGADFAEVFEATQLACRVSLTQQWQILFLQCFPSTMAGYVDAMAIIMDFDLSEAAVGNGDGNRSASSIQCIFKKLFDRLGRSMNDLPSKRHSVFRPPRRLLFG